MWRSVICFRNKDILTLTGLRYRGIYFWIFVVSDLLENGFTGWSSNKLWWQCYCGDSIISIISTSQNNWNTLHMHSIYDQNPAPAIDNEARNRVFLNLADQLIKKTPNLKRKISLMGFGSSIVWCFPSSVCLYIIIIFFGQIIL